MENKAVSLKINLAKMFFWMLFLLAGYRLRIHFVEGGAAFSWIGIMLPVTFGLFPIGRSAVLGAVMCSLRYKLFSLTLGIPTLFASLSWTASKQQKGLSDRLLHLILPLTCISLFCLFVTDRLAFLYVLFWFIPMILYFTPLEHPAALLIGRTLKSTFTAHALGSVIWAYFIPMKGIEWIALMPVVVVERLLMVSLSVLTLIIFKTLFSHLENFLCQEDHTVTI